jgi:hypothetical protein
VAEGDLQAALVVAGGLAAVQGVLEAVPRGHPTSGARAGSVAWGWRTTWRTT